MKTKIAVLISRKRFEHKFPWESRKEDPKYICVTKLEDVIWKEFTSYINYMWDVDLLENVITRIKK